MITITIYLNIATFSKETLNVGSFFSGVLSRKFLVSFDTARVFISLIETSQNIFRYILQIIRDKQTNCIRERASLPDIIN